MPITDDEIREKYLERAIRELNTLARELQTCSQCPRGNLMPVLGSGHPQADIMLLKYAPLPSEAEEGVAFYGRSGSALMKSFKRLGIDPLVVYGTLCVKCPIADPSLADPACVARVVQEIAIVAPKVIVVMGPEALAVLGELPVPLARPLRGLMATSSSSRPRSRLSTYRTSTNRSTSNGPSAASGTPSASWASGTRPSRRTEARYRVRTILPSLPPAAKRS